MRVKAKVATRARGKPILVRKRFCRFCADKTRIIDYKDTKTLESFIRERGKIISSRNTGNCAKHQRKLTAEIKKAKFMALLPYVRY